MFNFAGTPGSAAAHPGDEGRLSPLHKKLMPSVKFDVDPHRMAPNLRGVVMKRGLLALLAVATAGVLTASGFNMTAAAQSDQKPTHAELVQHWAEAALDTQLKGMKTSLRLTADQDKDWGPFESTVKDVAKVRVV